MEAGGGEGFKAAPDFLFCCWKSKFPLLCSPKKVTLHSWAAHGWVPAEHCCKESQPGLCSGGLDWWEAAGFPWGMVLLQLSNT